MKRKDAQGGRLDWRQRQFLRQYRYTHVHKTYLSKIVSSHKQWVSPSKTNQMPQSSRCFKSTFRQELKQVIFPRLRQLDILRMENKRDGKK